MSSAREQRADLESRGAVLREKVDELLGQFESRTARLREAQQAAAALTATLASPDGRVRVTIDATGMLAELYLAPTAFDRSRPDALARVISDLARRGAIQVRRQAAELLRPLTEGLPDLSDLAEGAPSLAEALPKIPEYPAPEPSAPTGSPAHPHSGAGPGNPPPGPATSPAPVRQPHPAPTQPPRPTAAEDDMPASWLKDNEF